MSVRDMIMGAAGGAGGSEKMYVEDVFSTHLFTGNGSTQTITNGIDMTEGGLYWVKQRSDTGTHWLWDSARGATKSLATDDTAAQAEWGANGPVFNNGSITDRFGWGSGYTQATWTFRKQPKFFDVVTYTGNGVNGRQIPHALDSVPGCIIVKNTSTATNWSVWHRGASGGDSYGELNTTATFPAGGGKYVWGNNSVYIPPTATNFSVASDSKVNSAGATYVAYLFAHDAGGFGLSGNENVVSCGSFTANGSGVANVNVGYEPQLVLYKLASTTGPWLLMDSMRGMPDLSSNLTTSNTTLFPNTSAAESGYDRFWATSTGFYLANGTASATYIYIAIRRGPMKVPTLGTTVYNADFYGGPNSPPSWNSGFVTDLGIWKDRTGGASNAYDRLRGEKQLQMNSTNAESTDTTAKFDYMTGFGTASGAEDTTLISWNFRRAPSFFDEVCYTGNGSTQTIAHNLTVVPQLIIGKNRTVAGNNWSVNFNFAPTTQSYAFLNQTVAGGNDIYANVGVFSASPTSTSMFLTNSGSMNASGSNIVAYLFATAPGVSKVGSYTGTGATQAINCGFTTGARFVLIKRTDSTGDWYVWDSARGIVAGNDPYLLMNTTAAEVTSTDYVDTSATGFELTSTAPAAINASGGSYIFLAVA